MDQLSVAHYLNRLADGTLFLAFGVAAVWTWAVPKLAAAYWPALEEFFGGSPLLLFGFGTWLAHFLFVACNNLVLWACYSLELPFFEKYKIERYKPWPWKQESKERERFWPIFWSGLRQVLFNNFFIALPAGFITFSFRPKGAFSTSLSDFPTASTLVWQTLVCAVVEDAMFYTSHRLLHTKRLYQLIHKQHHKFHHTIGLASENAHPVEFLMGNLIPVVAGPLLLSVLGWPVHTFGFVFWVWFRVGESADAHSGYAFPWSPFRLLPFSSSSEAHDYHHSHNKGCFASQFTFLDHFFGTDASFLAYQQQQDKEKALEQAAELQRTAQKRAAESSKTK